MRLLPIFLLLPQLVGCGADPATISGTVDPELGVTQVWVLGGAERAVVEEGSFLIEEVTGDTVELRFADEEGERGRMRILGVRPGARIELEGVWAEDERMYPARVRLEGVERVEINGLRHAAQASDEVDASGVVLAVSSAGDAFLFRPDDGSLPDLRVVVTPGSRVSSPDGEPLDADGLERGDSVHLRASREGSYLVATELTMPRETAGRDESVPRTSRPLLGVPVTEAREPEERGKGRDRGKGRGKGREKARG